MMGTRLISRYLAPALLGTMLFATAGAMVAQQRPLHSAGGEQATPAGTSAQANQEERDENDVYRHSPMVAKLGHMAGMSTEAASTAFEVGNFALLAIGVGFVLMKRVPKTFRDRSSTIQKHLLEARVAR